MEEAKRQEVAILLRAQVRYSKIMEQCDVNRSTVKRVRRYLEDGIYLKSKSHGGHNKKLTPRAFFDLLKSIKAKPFESVTNMAKTKGLSKASVSRGLDKCGLESKPCPQRQLLTETTKSTRFLKAKRLLCQLKKKPPSTVIIFSDKKMFTVDQSFNRRNSRAVVSKGDDVPVIQKTKHPQGVISSDGKKCPSFNAASK